MRERMRDSAYADKIPASWPRAVAGYLDGGDQLHAWTAADWKRFRKNRKLPVFLRTKIGADAVQHGRDDAFTVLRQLYDLGVPRGVYVALDVETVVSPAYVEAFGAVLRWAGFRVLVYGSAGTVFGNPGLDGYWVAAYVNPPLPYMYSHRGVAATQYTDKSPGGAWDSSAVGWVAYGNLSRWWR